MGGWVVKIVKKISPLLPGVADGPGDPGGVRYLVGKGNRGTGGTPRRCGRTRESWDAQERSNLDQPGFWVGKGCKGKGKLGVLGRNRSQ